MSPDGNRAVVRRYLELWNSGDVAVLDEVIGDAYVGYTGPDHASTRDRHGLEARIRAFRATFPTVQFTVQDQIAEADKVATQLVATGIDSVTEASLIVVGMNVSRCAAGKVVEEWAYWDADQLQRMRVRLGTRT